MTYLLIGALARRFGIAPSAIRYYEKAGLMPNAPRQSGRRRYGLDAIGRMQIILVAREAGFSIAETKLFLSGFSVTTRPAARWRALAERKLLEFDQSMVRMARMRAVLESSFRCDCLRIEDCERAITAASKRS